MNKLLHLLFGTTLMAVVFSTQIQAQTLKPDTTKLPDVMVCKAALPYVYAGVNYYTPGFKELHFTGSRGQDSLCTFALSIANNPTKSVRIGACRNVLGTTGVSFNGKKYYASGVYVDTLSGGTSCDTVVTLIVDSYATYADTLRLAFCQGETYLGTVLTTPGTSLFRVENLKTKSCQCDSVVNTYVTVHPTYNKHDSITVCESSLPYNWRGLKSLFQTKDDTVKLFTSNGCDSIFTIRFTVKPSPATSDYVVVCPDVLKNGYTYGNKTFYHADIDNVTFTAANGCDSTVTLTIYEGKDYHIYLNPEVCQSELPYYFMTETGLDSLNGTGRDTAFFTSVNGCDSIIYLTLHVNNDKTARVNASICDNELPYRFAGKDIFAGGEHQFTFPTQKGCDSIITLSLTVNQTFVKDTSIAVCSDMLPFFFLGDTLNKSGDFTYALKTQAGCDSTLKLHLTVNATSMVSDEVTVCENAFPYTYAGQSFPTEGYYTITLRNSKGCDSIIALHINKRVIPSAPTQIYGLEKIGKEGVYIYYIDQVDHFYPITQYQWSVPSGWTIVNQNREGDSIWVEIPDNIGLSEGDITVYAFNECGQSDSCLKHIKTYIKCTIRVYPNPVIRNGEVTIEFNDLIGKNKLRITDVTGRILHQEELNITENHEEIRIYLGDFACGDYFIRVQTKDLAILKKLVVLKEENSSK